MPFIFDLKHVVTITTLEESRVMILTKAAFRKICKLYPQDPIAPRTSRLTPLFALAHSMKPFRKRPGFHRRVRHNWQHNVGITSRACLLVQLCVLRVCALLCLVVRLIVIEIVCFLVCLGVRLFVSLFVWVFALVLVLVLVSVVSVSDSWCWCWC